MTRSNNTRHALLMSMVSILLCIAMLIGSTFAWFTDTASTNVNTIQSGTLDVELYKSGNATGTGDNWTKIENNSSALGWIQATAPDGTTTTIVDTNGLPLWEPGATFSLPALKIVNEGSLALKYKIIVSGIQGNAKLNEVITWTMKLGNDTSPIGTEHKLAAKPAEGESADIFTISGTMKDTAGNEYQGLSISGISITVYATQDTVEYDSSRQDYDALAEYPVFVVQNVEVEETKSLDGKVTATKVKKQVEVKTTEMVSANGTEAPVAKATVEADTVLEAGTTQVALSIVNTAKTAENTTVTNDQESKSFEIKLDGVSETNDKPITVEFYTEKGLTGVTVYHKGIPMSNDENNDTGEYYSYDNLTGKVTVVSKTFSPFDLVYDKPNVTLPSTSEQLEESLKEDGTVILSKDIAFGGTLHEDGDRLDTIIEGAEYVHLVLNSELKSDSFTETAWGLIRVADTVQGSTVKIHPTFVISGNNDGKFINTTNDVATVCITGGDVIINSGYFENISSDSKCFHMMPADEASQALGYSLTINGGEFKAGTVVYADWGANVKITINGGVFKSDNVVVLDTYNGKYKVSDCTVATINGGTFYNWDPTAYVDTSTHTVNTTTSDTGTIYTVTAK